MATTLKTALAAALIGLSGLAAVPASAQGLYLDFGNNRDNGGFRVYPGDDRYPRERYYGMRPGCSTGRALDKAYRMGLDDVRVRRVTQRRIVVVGYDNGDRVRVTFARAPGCPVLD